MEIQRQGQGPWVSAKRGTLRASPGDRLRTGPNSFVHVITPSGARVALGPRTQVVLREPERPRGWRVVVGKIIAFLTGGGRLEVRAPGAIAAAEGTVFQVEVDSEGTTVLTVVEGQVDFSNEWGRVVVLTSQQSMARPGAAPSRPVVVDPSGIVAWEANLQTMFLEPEWPALTSGVADLAAEQARFQRLVEENPNDAEARVGLVKTLLDLGAWEEAEKQAREGLARAPDSGPLHGLLGLALARSGNPGEATQELQEAEALQPDQPWWPLGLGLLALCQRDAQPSVSLLERAAERAPKDPTAKAYLAAAHLRLGNLPAAQAAVSAAVALDPNHPIAQSQAALVRLAQGDLAGAVAAGQAATRAAPSSARAHEALGTALFFSGRFPEAARELERSIELNPLGASAHLTWAKLLAAEDRIDEALRNALLAVGLNPQSAPAYSTLGLLFLLNNDPQRAGKAFQSALSLDPTLAEARTGWGQILARRGRFKEALNEQKAALALDTDSAATENNLGGVYASLGRMAEARLHLEKAIALQPGWGLPYANLALVHLEENRYREALEAGEKAVQLGERSAFLHTVLARIYARQGRTDRALAELRQALALDDTFPQARFQLAQLYVQQGRARDAVREVLFAVTTDPSAMLETRRYARSEGALWGGHFRTLHAEGRHSSPSPDGKFSYFASGLWEDTSGHRSVNGDSQNLFAETIAGYQPQDRVQWAFYGTAFGHKAGLPGPATAGRSGDPDDRQNFAAQEAFLAYRERLGPGLAATFKASFTQEDRRFRNPGSLADGDTTPFRTLDSEQSKRSLEVRLDQDLRSGCSLKAGLAHAWTDRMMKGLAGTTDPDTGQMAFAPFSTQETPEATTAWFEVAHRFEDRLHLTVGGYWSQESRVHHTAMPKVVALYRPDPDTWLSATALPIFRSDATELAPVEALADPLGLNSLDFVEGGGGRSYELRCQRRTSRSTMLTGSVTYQRVRGLLIDTQDPQVTGLPARALVGRGHRWVVSPSYEQWLADSLTGRVWVRWQRSRGSFPQSQLSGKEWPYAPRWEVGGRLDFIDRFGWRVGFEGTWVGRRFHDPKNTQALGSYAVFNLFTQYQRNLQERYFLNVLNLTDRNYVTFSGFPQPALTLTAGLEYRF